MTQPGSKKKGAPVAARRFPWAIIMALGGLLLAAAVIVAGMSAGRSQQDQTAGAGGPSLDIAAIERSPAGPVEGLKVDFGELKMGSDMATVQLTVRNRGAKALQFSQAPYVELAEGCWPPKAVIGSMTLQPGESTTVSVQFTMIEDMGGPHDFRLHLPTNDPLQPDVVVTILSNWVE